MGRTREIFGDAMAILLGVVFACLVAAGAAVGAWKLLSLQDPRWDGEVPFIVRCPPEPGGACLLESEAEHTPRMARDGRPSGTISQSAISSGIPDLRAGDRVVCIVHVGGSDVNDNDSNGPYWTAEKCKRS
ncbi:hypothetical protein Ntsu_59900 [Nocardia sp. IFM 10818]